MTTIQISTTRLATLALLFLYSFAGSTAWAAGIPGKFYDYYVIAKTGTSGLTSMGTAPCATVSEKGG